MRITVSVVFVLLWAAGLLASPRASAQPVGIAGIVEGGATLIRQATRHALAEGVALNEQDIVETAPHGFAQIELPGGVLVGMGGGTRVMLRPRVARGLPATPLYLLQGWLKTTASGPFRYTSPGFELSAPGAATTVVHYAAGQSQVFVEGGTARLAWRDGPQPPVQLGSSDFAQRRAGAAAAVARRPTPDFLDGVPRQFRDRLPARGEQFAKRSVAPKPAGEVAYNDVAHWLQAEPGLRLPLLQLWRGRASDPNFRAAAKANLARHPEWEPYADPEGYARRLAQEAERRREREEAARQAAARAAAAAAGAPAAGGAPPAHTP